MYSLQIKQSVIRCMLASPAMQVRTMKQSVRLTDIKGRVCEQNL